ncbi:MAG: CAP domain-containing protein [Thermoleophilaceae bacterium]
MARTRTLCVALIAAALLLLTTTLSAQAGARRHMIGAINSARGWGHIHRVHLSRRLSRGASFWAHHLMRANVIAHSAGALRRHEGEIIEWHTGGRARVGQVVREWLNSPPHRGVMLARGYHRAGAGRAVGRIGGRRATIWVVRFAR